MKTRLTAPACQQADRIDRWWREHRQAAPDLFARELAEARRLLAESPEMGTPYKQCHGTLVRRVQLPKTQNHVYYGIDRVEDAVMILAVWGAPRGRGPKL